MAGLRGSRARALTAAAAVSVAALGFVPGLTGSASANTTGTNISSPSGDVTVTDSSAVSINVSIVRTNDKEKTGGLNGKPADPDDGSAINLTLTDPTGNEIGTWSSTGNSGSNYQKNLPASATSLSPYSGLTGGNGRAVVNGTYVLHMTGGSSGAGGSRDVTRSITFRVPPQTPSGVSVSPYSGTVARLTWSENTEPDLQAYDILSNGALLGRVTDAQVCSSGVCTADIPFKSDQAAGSHSFSVKAYRSSAPGSSDLLASAESQTVSTTLSGPPPKPSPTPTPTQGGGSGGGSTGGTGGSTGGSTGGGTGGSDGGDITGGGGTGSGGSGSAGGTGGTGGKTSPTPIKPGATYTRHPVTQSISFAPLSGIVKLPQLPSLNSQLPGAAPEDEGTFAPTLAYGDQDVTELSESQKAGSTDSLISSVTDSLKSRQLGQAFAIALILLMIGLHVRQWQADGDVTATGERRGRRRSDGGYDW